MLVGYGVEHVVYGVCLIVARLTASATVQRFEVEAVAPLVILGECHLPQLLRRWKFVYELLGRWHGVIAVRILNAHIDEVNLVAVGGIGVTNLQHFGILLGLRHAHRNVCLVGLCLYYSEFYALVFQNVVHLLGVACLQFLHTTGRNEVCALFV